LLFGSGKAPFVTFDLFLPLLFLCVIEFPALP
jgi:hypothetical protein